jgi:hypothetical protein
VGFFSSTPGRCCKNVLFILEQGMKAERGSRGYSTLSLTAARDEVGRQRHAPATLPPAIGAVVVPRNCLRPRQYSHIFAVPPYYIRYGLITASKHPHNHPADVSSYVHRAVTVNITAIRYDAV